MKIALDGWTWNCCLTAFQNNSLNLLKLFKPALNLCVQNFGGLFEAGELKKFILSFFLKEKIISTFSETTQFGLQDASLDLEDV